MHPFDDLDQRIRRGYGLALVLTHNEHQAEDLLQDAWVVLLRRGEPRSAAAVMRAVHDRFLELEKRERLVALEPLDDGGDEAGELAFLDLPSPSPDAPTLHYALDALRPLEREAVYLAAAEGCTIEGIAELTGQLPGAVRSLVRRARRKLRSHLGLRREESRS